MFGGQLTFDEFALGEPKDPNYECGPTKREAGGQGAVFNVVWTRRLCKLKVGKEATDQTALEEESRMLMTYSHPNIVKALAVRTKSPPAVLLEKASESLAHAIDRANRGGPELTVMQRFDVAIDIASALSYLHQRLRETGINDAIHRDVKPENILLFDTPDPNAVKLGERAARGDHRQRQSVVAKLADFGISHRRRTNYNNTVLGSFEGTVKYLVCVLLY